MKYIVYSLLLIIMFSCNKNEGSSETLHIKIKSFKKITLPDSKMPARKQLKIVTYINGDCYACVKELAEWKGFFINDSSRVQFLFFFSSLDTAHFFSYVKEHFDFGYPLFYDKESEYLTKNNIKKYDKMFQTFLLDKNDSVVLVGNPFLNKRLMNLYRQEIDRRTQKPDVINK